MRTDDLIRAISADAARRSPPLRAAWWAAAAVSFAVAAVAFFILLGPRADIALAAETPRFLFKFLVTGLLAASAFALLRLLARPGAPVSRAAPLLALAPLLLADVNKRLGDGTLARIDLTDVFFDKRVQ